MNIAYIFLVSLCAVMLVLVQAGLFFGFPFPLVFLLVLALAYFENKYEVGAFAAAFFGGMFQDMYSQYPFGLYLLSLLTLAWIIKFILRKYVELPAV